jgi:hypothetical protein
MRRLLVPLGVAAVIVGATLGFLGWRRQPPRTPPELEGAPAPAPAGTRSPSASGAGRESAPSTAPSSRAPEQTSPSPAVAPLPQGEAELVFTIRGTDGQPPPREVSVTLQWARTEATAAADGNGAARFSRLAAGHYTFVVDAEGLPPLGAMRALELQAGERKEIELRLGRFDEVISGRVLDRSGQPVPDIIVRAHKHVAEPGDGDLRPRTMDPSGKSDEEGRYTVEGLEAADYILSTEPLEGQPTVQKVFRAGSRSADLILGATRTLVLHGKTSARGGEPLGGVRIQPLGRASRQAESAPDGSYELEAEIAEDQSVLLLIASREGWRELRTNVHLAEVGEAERWEVSLVLDPLGARGSIRGRLHTADGAPLAGETIHVHAASVGARQHSTSDAEGRFELAGLEVAGDYRLWVYPKSGYEDHVRSPLVLGEDGMELDIELLPLATAPLRGRMVDAAGQPVAGMTLWVRSLKSLASATAVRGGSDGRFAVDAVPAGELLFETRSLPRLAIRGVRHGPETAAEDVELVVDWGRLELAGQVVDPGGNPAAGASVTLHWTGGAESAQSSSYRTAVTDAEGRFAFTELGPGEHRLQVNAAGYAPAQTEHEVGGTAPGPVIRLEKRTRRE